jgi:copper chaperone CopZ
MKATTVLGIGLLLCGAAASRAADTPPTAVRDFQVPRSYLARGSTAEADLTKLRAAIATLPGVTKVTVQADEDGATVTIDGDGSSTQSLMAAAARNAGYRLRPAPTRYYLATGPSGDTDLMKLRSALRETAGIDQVALSRGPQGAALRVGGVARNAAIVAAGERAGCRLDQLASYVASGSSTEPDLARLREALSKLAGVKRVEMQGLIGGATLLIHGDTNDERMAAAGKNAGFIVWPLGIAEGKREFRIDDRVSAEDREKLVTTLRALEGIGELEVRAQPEGDRLLVNGGRARPPAIVSAAARAGFTLVPIETVTLPTVVPQAERGTPPDYENRVLEDEARPGGPAPGFSLLAKDGRTVVSLSDYAGKRPVVLLFGSCT